MEELDLRQTEQVSGGNALDTVSGSFVAQSPGETVCYAIGGYFGISSWFMKPACER